MLVKWLNYKADPRCYPNPLQTTVKVPDIQPGEGPADYETCLEHLGITNYQRETVPAGQAVLDQPAGAMASVAPGEGSEINPGDDVVERINPDPLPDPLTQGEDDRSACDRSTPEYPVPRPPSQQSITTFDPITDSTLVADPTFPSSHGNTTLRWGTVTLDMGSGTPDYEGWGYQKTKAKHGWSLLDDADTRQALIDGIARPVERDQGVDPFEFYGREYEQNGVRCVREVLVDFGTHPGESDPKAIITSLGRPAAEVPRFDIPGA